MNMNTVKGRAKSLHQTLVAIKGWERTILQFDREFYRGHNYGSGPCEWGQAQECCALPRHHQQCTRTGLLKQATRAAHYVAA